MRHARVFAIAGLTVVITAAAYAAQTSGTPSISDEAPVVEETAIPVEDVTAADAEAPVREINLRATHWGDPIAGRDKAATCIACHSTDGNSVADIYPRTAGQSEIYMARQIALIATGQRTSGLSIAMLPFVSDMEAQDMRDLGAFFSRQRNVASGSADDTVITGGPYEGMKVYEVGQKLYRGGNKARNIPACIACHGPTGAGNPGAAYPRIGGQFASYTERRLQEYRTGVTEEKDPSFFNIMATVSHSLTDQEIEALSSYMQGLHNTAQDIALVASMKTAATPTAAPEATEPTPEPAPEPDSQPAPNADGSAAPDTPASPASQQS
ncbi:MAG: c-type cytochrome [Xanthomonadaceae bacterium]|jgi:cytochrome c553|nr:c-type cytochrome [Xanthomonadaceae bacterium]